MFSMYDKIENNTYEIRSTAFTARDATFGFITRPLMHAPFVNQGKWGTVTLHLTSGKGAAETTPADSYMQLVPVHHGEEIAFALETKPEELLIHTAYGDIRCCFAEPGLLLMKGEGGLGIRFETMLPPHGVIRKRGENAWERRITGVSCFVFNGITGKMEMNPKWEMERLSTPYVRGELFPEEDGTFLLSIEETEELGRVRDSYPAYEEGLTQVRDDWNSFYTGLPGKEDKNKEKAAFMLWSMFERPSGRLKRRILHSTFQKAAPAWKACLMTKAFPENLPFAMDILLGQLDQQAEDGLIPSLFDHFNYDALNAAPPLQGWALKQLMKKNDLKATLSEEDLRRLYHGYAAWAAWFDAYRDDDRDGIVQTEGVLESGCIDSPVFNQYYIVDLPDINAELALLEESVGDLAGMLDLTEEKDKWHAKSKDRIRKILDTFWNGERFIGFDHETKEKIDPRSLQFYRPLILGKRLPKYIVDKMSEDLSFANGFLTPHGFLSQHMNSPEFSRLSIDGGSINSWDNIMITTGLLDAGKTELAKEAAAAYCNGLTCPTSSFYNSAPGFDSAETAAAYIILNNLKDDECSAGTADPEEYMEYEPRKVKAPEYTFYLVRHGETLFNARGVSQGWSDSPLTREGVEMAKKLGRSFANIDFDACYTSISERAYDTANYIINGRNIPLYIDKNLKETNLGTVEGLKDTVPMVPDRLQRGWTEEGGETMPETAERIDTAIHKIIDENPDGGTFLVSSHGGALTSYIIKLFGDTDLWDEFVHGKHHGFMPNCATSIAHYSDGRFTLESLSDVSYLE